MIIFLYGQDTYRLRNKLKEIIASYQKVHQSGLNLKYFEGKNLDFHDFKQEFQTTSMFKEKKLMVLKNVFSNREFKNSFLENSKNFTKSDNIILFQEEGEVPPKDPLFNFLKKNAKIQEFQLLQGQKLKNWVKKEFEKYSAEADPRAVADLINFIGNNLWQFSNEIKKIATFKRNKKITAEDVNILVKPKIETDIFKTIDAIASKDKKKALALLHKHLEKGDSHLYLLAMISFQFRNLLTVKSGAKLKMHPYVVRKTTQQARAFSLEELKKIYHQLFEIDYKIKTGKVDPQTALDLFISEV
jgi:DNA polymerase-3 subunit delta